MNPEIKAQWIADLRSENFAQGQGLLRTGDQYCCLGVLCELAVEAGVISAQENGDGMFKYGIFSDDFNVSDTSLVSLPDAVCRWAEIYDPDPMVPVEVDGNVRNEYLATLNDSNYSFGEIADLIEENL